MQCDTKPYSAPNKEIYAWAISGIASHGLICTFGQASVIFTIGFRLSAVVVGWAMMLPRVFDAILDPWLGHLSDNTHTRWGRRKPFLLGASIAGAALLFALWWASPKWSPTAQLAYLFVVGTLFYLSYGLYTMAWMALGYELTDDYHERSRVAAISGLFATIVFFAAGWMYWLALRPVFGGEIYGIRWVAGGMAMLIIVAALPCVWVCRERFTTSNHHHTSIVPAIRTTLKNKPFVVLLIFKLCQVFGDRVYGGLLLYIGVYYVCQGNKSAATWYTGIGSGIGTVLSLLMVPFMKRISQKVGKRNGLVLASLISFGLAALQPLILRPSMPYLLIVPQMILLPLVMLANTLGTAIVPDICDLDELESGQRREGLFTAVMGFVQKLEISLTVLIVGYLVNFSGFDSQLTIQPQAVQHKLLWLATLPYILFTAITVAVAWMFPMTENGMADIRRQLDHRRAATSDSRDGSVALEEPKRAVTATAGA